MAAVKLPVQVFSIDLTKNKQAQGWLLPTGWETETVGTFMEDENGNDMEDDDNMEMEQV